MIRILWLLVLLVVGPLAAQSQPVQVTSGEHDGFTRIVLNFGSAQDWQVGRTTDGYELRLAGISPTYDLTGVYDPIGRGRLASIWVDPQSGTLRIGIGCACHAQPFEFRPDIVVIDLKDGPPPKGSAFETALGGEELQQLAPRPIPRPRARPPEPDIAALMSPAVDSYDWTATILTGRAAQPTQGDLTETAVAQTVSLPGADPALQSLRAALMHQLSRGAAQGVVDMAQFDSKVAQPPSTGPIRVQLSSLPGVRIETTDHAPKGLTAEGVACVADEKLDIASWGTDQPISEQMGEAMAGLMGEFDAPDPAAELRAARFLLFIGFGAEMRQVLEQLSSIQPDAKVLASLSHILDSTDDPQPAFVDMAACDGAAALWAILGGSAPEPGVTLDRAAVLRSFSALPVHLRRLTGPLLADRLLGLKDPDAAAAVRNAILRAPGDAGPGVVLMEARLDLDAGDPESAERRLDPLIVTSGPATPEALIAQVATHLARRAPLEPAQITALEGLLHERRDSPDAPRFALALAQARALAGDYDSAMADLADAPDAAADVWALLAEIGPDSAVLSHAIRSAGTMPQVSQAVAATLARRLSDLGFPAPAREWLLQVPVADTALAAKIALQANDALSALELVANTTDPALVPLQAQALYQLADEKALANLEASRGEEDARWRAVGRSRDWQEIAGSGPAPWRDLAEVAIGAVEDSPAAPGPLARGQTLLESSSQTRQQIDDLLAAVASPVSAGF